MNHSAPPDSESPENSTVKVQAKCYGLFYGPAIVPEQKVKTSGGSEIIDGLIWPVSFGFQCFITINFDHLVEEEGLNFYTWQGRLPVRIASLDGKHYQDPSRNYFQNPKILNIAGLLKFSC